MARMNRLKVDENACYHVVSRIAGRQFLLADEGVKAQMEGILARVAAFSGVEVGGYAFMDNHFHIFCRVVDEGIIPEEEVVRRVGVLHGERRAGELAEALACCRKAGDDEAIEELLGGWRRRMDDLSAFVKTFKETFGRWYRSGHDWVGTLWGERFKSTLVEDGKYLRDCADYIELNPVRGGLSPTSEEYRWCTTGAAKMGIAFAEQCLANRRRWMQGVEVTGEGAQAAEGTVPSEAAEGTVPSGAAWEEEMAVRAMLMRPCPQLTSGKIYGRIEFVERIAGERAKTDKQWERVRAHEMGGRRFSSHGHRLAKRVA